jgi:hypothetical protein
MIGVFTTFILFFTMLLSYADHYNRTHQTSVKEEEKFVTGARLGRSFPRVLAGWF